MVGPSNYILRVYILDSHTIVYPSMSVLEDGQKAITTTEPEALAEVSFAGSGVAGFFRGCLKFLVIIIGSFLGAVFLVVQWMRANTIRHILE